jgi:hypothetical protein
MKPSQGKPSGNFQFRNAQQQAPKPNAPPRNIGDRRCLLTVKFCQPSHEFTFGVGMSLISYPLVLTLVV